MTVAKRKALDAKIAKEIKDVEKALEKGLDDCRKTEASLRSDLGKSKRALTAAKGQLTKAKNKIRTLEGKVSGMKAAQLRSLAKAKRGAKELGVEAVRLGKLVQYYKEHGRQLKRKGGKSWIDSPKTRTKRTVCGPKGKIDKKRASKAASRIRRKVAKPGDGKTLAFKRWCDGVKRNFNKYSQEF